ncbi:hypothetical protein SDC9_179030 [bioreactor metagenome]|uniref:Uncharacterized protein n=1 Tax=bioreactor metagenome TaxID=1076179 RepID=A0A645GZ89_9ZZZZ
MTSYAPGDVGGLNGGHGLARVGDQDRQVVLAYDRRGHVPDEVHIKTQLNEPDGEELPYQSRPAGPVDEYRLLLQQKIDQPVLRLLAYGGDRIGDLLLDEIQ